MTSWYWGEEAEAWQGSHVLAPSTLGRATLVAVHLNNCALREVQSCPDISLHASEPQCPRLHTGGGGVSIASSCEDMRRGV